SVLTVARLLTEHARCVRSQEASSPPSAVRSVLVGLCHSVLYYYPENPLRFFASSCLHGEIFWLRWAALCSSVVSFILCRNKSSLFDTASKNLPNWLTVSGLSSGKVTITTQRPESSMACCVPRAWARRNLSEYRPATGASC